jgi:broad specificity phosphatase PhoE
MPVVLLVRHGQVAADAADYDVLSEVGRHQSRIVGDELRRRALREPIVVTGAMHRQQDSARHALAQLQGVREPHIDARWNEYDHQQLLADHGDLTSYDGGNQSLQRLLDHALTRWIAMDAQNGWAGFQTRVRAALASVLSTLPAGRDAVVFTSGGVIATVAAELTSAGPAAVVPFNRALVNGSITKLIVGPAGASLITFNEHAHFEGERRALLTYR